MRDELSLRDEKCCICEYILLFRFSFSFGSESVVFILLVSETAIHGSCAVVDSQSVKKELLQHHIMTVVRSDLAIKI